MSSDNQDVQWGANGAQRGPSFEDPSQSTPEQPASAPEQSWDQAWGVGDTSQPGVGNHWQGQAAGDQAFGGAPGYGAQPAQAAPYAASPQDPYGAPQNPYGAQQNAWGGQPNPYAPQQQYPDQGLYGPADPYQQPYGSYGGYGAYAYTGPAKSKVAAALLAFFLGGFGAHSFYLNKKNLGFIHLGLGVGSFILLVVVGALSDGASASSEAGIGMVALLATLMSLGNGIWAFVEFIMILVKPEHELGR